MSTVLEAVVATAAVLVVLWSPLFARARLDESGLVIGFGLLGGMRAPATAIATVEPHAPDPLHPVQLGVDVIDGTEAFSRRAGQDYVHIRLRTPVPCAIRSGVAASPAP